MFKIQKFFVTITLLGISFYLYNSMTKKFPEQTDKISSAIVVFFSPIIKTINQPYLFVINTKNELKNFFLTRAQLKRKVQELESIEEKFYALSKKTQDQEKEICELRELINLSPLKKQSYFTVRVLGFPSNSYFSNFLIENHEKEILQKNMVVVSSKGLVGRITSVSRDNAKVMLLTDIESRVPVKVASSKEQAILVGNGSNNLLIANLELLEEIDGNSNSQIKVGDELITSGTGGVFPAGIPVAFVYEIKDCQVYAKPIVNFHNLSFVMILKEQCYQNQEIL
jgi:rod shape-determining protein MreC